MTEREREICTIMTVVRDILISSHLTLTTKEKVNLLLEDSLTGETYLFKVFEEVKK